MNTSSVKTQPVRSLLAGAAVIALVAGCSTVAEPNPTLDRAHANYTALQADPQSTLMAPTEMSQAGEALRTADAAWTKREKQGTVDHLAYLAQQRVEIARETSSAKTWEKVSARPRLALMPPRRVMRATGLAPPWPLPGRQHRTRPSSSQW